MLGMQVFGIPLIILGVLLLIAGILFSSGLRVPFFGKLPGDIIIERNGTTLFLPITSAIILSILVSLIFSTFFRGS